MCAKIPHMKRVLFTPALLCVVVFSLCPSAYAWWPQGHGILSEAAVRSLPPETPQFFRDEAKIVAHYSFDPDVAKNKAAPHVTNAEYSEHFFDWELIEKPLAESLSGNRALPEARYEFLKFCFQNKVEPNDVGLLPYAVAEWTERLTIDFAQHRRWPQNKAIQNKCLVSAGTLAHYAEDLCQPLHVTIDHDGRANADGSSPKSGIHALVDGFVEVLELSTRELALGQKIESVGELLPAVVAEIHNSRAQIETVYGLQAVLPKAGAKPGATDPAVIRFTNERSREATRFTAALFLTAWRRSADVELPVWLKRMEK